MSMSPYSEGKAYAQVADSAPQIRLSLPQPNLEATVSEYGVMALQYEAQQCTSNSHQ